jgi:hypothetical protein
MRRPRQLRLNALSEILVSENIQVKALDDAVLFDNVSTIFEPNRVCIGPVKE